MELLGSSRDDAKACRRVSLGAKLAPDNPEILEDAVKFAGELTPYFQGLEGSDYTSKFGESRRAAALAAFAKTSLAFKGCLGGSHINRRRRAALWLLVPAAAVGAARTLDDAVGTKPATCGNGARAGGARRAECTAWEKVTRWCGETDEGAYARDLLAALNPGSIKGEKDEANASEPAEEEVVWEHKPYLEHYFGMLVPVGRGNVEELKATISDFHSSLFASKNLRVTANLINRNFQIVLILSGWANLIIFQSFKMAF